jgi:hypothetical protein
LDIEREYAQRATTTVGAGDRWLSSKLPALIGLVQGARAGTGPGRYARRRGGSVMAYREASYDTESCLGCNSAVPAGTQVCPACGAPVEVAQYAELELALKPALRSARLALTIPATVSGLVTALLVILALAAGVPPAAAIPTATLTALFIVAAAGVQRWPFFSTLLGLALFVLVEAVNVVLDPLVLFPGVGLVVRILISFVLYNGVRAGYRARDLRRQARRHDLAVAITTLVVALFAGVAAGVEMPVLVRLFGL